MNRRCNYPLFIFLLCGSTLAIAQTTQPAPSAEQVRNKLLSSGPSAKAMPPATDGLMTDAATGKNAIAPGASAMTVMREGTFIVNRVGRLTRSADGQQMEFTFDADSKAMKDPPLVILPNLKLMQMENAVSGNSRDLRFRVSGMVTEYKSRNYVLLDKVVVVPDIDNQM